MNMNTERERETIEIGMEEYFRLIALPEEELQQILESDATKKVAFDRFEKYINQCEELENGNGIDHEGGLLPDSAKPILNLYQQYITTKLKEKETRTPREERLVEKYCKEQNQTEDDKNNVVPIRTRMKEQNYYTPNNKAGYIDATIILVMLLNIGFIVAMTILGGR